MKITCNNLIDFKTGIPVEIEISDSYHDYMENTAPMKEAAYESGVKFRKGLNDMMIKYNEQN